MDFRHQGANILGNFLIAFLMPLSANGVAQAFVTNEINVSVTLLTAMASATVMTGLSIAFELKKYGKGRR